MQQGAATGNAATKSDAATGPRSDAGNAATGGAK